MVSLGDIESPTPAQYKLTWFVGHDSSAPAHSIRSFFGTGWSVFCLPSSLHSHPTWLTLIPTSPYIVFTHSLHSHPNSSFTLLLSNMHSYQTLAVLALAVSTASPAISAPVQRYAPCFSTPRAVLADVVILLTGNRLVPSLTTLTC